MSEYQYYKFERLDGYLDAKARQALRSISSRAEISATSFQVYYTYSDLKAEPSELILKYFLITHIPQLASTACKASVVFSLRPLPALT